MLSTQSAPDHTSFKLIDNDGAYRSRLINCTMLDAVRLSHSQIATYLSAIEGGPVTLAELASASAHFANVDSSTASDEDLYNTPLEANKPVNKLAAAAATVGTSINSQGEITLFGANETDR